MPRDVGTLGGDLGNLGTLRGLGRHSGPDGGRWAGTLNKNLAGQAGMAGRPGWHRGPAPHIYVNIYIYIYIDTERERERPISSLHLGMYAVP